MAQPLRCHLCKQWIGQAPSQAPALRWVGVLEDSYRLKTIEPEPYAWRCPACRWTNMYAPAVTRTSDAPWRMVELKASG